MTKKNTFAMTEKMGRFTLLSFLDEPDYKGRIFMSQPRIPGDLSQPVRIASATVNQEMQPSPPPFSSLLQKNEGVGSATPATLSPMDLAQGIQKAQVTPQMLLAQVQTMQKTMGELQGQMLNPQLRLKTAEKYLLKNKLSSINSGMLAVNEKIEGSLDKEKSPHKEPIEEPAVKKLSGPLGQFLNYMTDGVTQLHQVKQQLGSLGDKGVELSPGDFLFIQIKLAKVQQEIEFTSAVLAKACEDFKTIMNVQL